MTFTIERYENGNPKALRRECWMFGTHDDHTSIVLLLQSYTVQTRPSTRHSKWIVEARWPKSREYRCANLPKPEFIPDDVLAEARQRVIDSIRVQIGWDR